MNGNLDFLLAALDLKDESRTGWVLRGVERPESVAAHTWGVALLCLLFAEEAGVDRERALAMALVHDVAEAVTGDVPTRAQSGAQPTTSAEKEAAERAAMDGLLAPVADPDELRGLWEAYEARETPTARFVKDMDLVENCLQALKYERDERYDPAVENDHFEEYDRLDEFFATAEPRLTTPLGRRLFERIQERYEAETADER